MCVIYFKEPRLLDPCIDNELRTLMMETELGRILLDNRFDLDNSDRSKLCLIIADFFINHQRKGSGQLFGEWSKMVIELFPNEKQVDYFRPATHDIVAGIKKFKRTSGKIPDTFYNRQCSIRNISKNQAKRTMKS